MLSGAGSGHEPDPLSDAGATGSGSGSPYLVSINQSRISTRSSKSFNRKQRRIYAGVKSFMLETTSRGAQLFWITLTSPADSDSRLLADHHKELVRRVKREFGYDVEYFVVKTREGNGVLHCVWSIVQKKAAYVPYEWLKAEWLKIHGAWNVHISRITTKSHMKNKAAYMVSQYMQGQDAIDRSWYSWDRCKLSLAKGWRSLKKIARSFMPTLYCDRLYGRMIEIKDALNMGQLIRAWESLLSVGWGVYDDRVYVIEDRQVVFKYTVDSAFSL